MNKKLRTLCIAGLTVLSLTLVACSGDDNMTNDNPSNQTQNTAVNDYERYLVDRYNFYFDNDKIDGQYDIYNIYDDDFDYTGTYDEFIVEYNDFYATEKANLDAFKKDIETNYKKGDPDVDKLHNEVITSIDKSITSMDEYSATFAEKTKDYGTLAKDEVIKGLRDIGRVPHEARLELDKLVDRAEEKLGIH